jgi:hypothetical protein
MTRSTWEMPGWAPEMPDNLIDWNTGSRFTFGV